MYLNIAPLAWLQAETLFSTSEHLKSLQLTLDMFHGGLAMFLSILLYSMCVLVAWQAHSREQWARLAAASMFGVVASSYNIFVTVTGWDEATATELPLWLQTVVILLGSVLFGLPLIREYSWLARQHHWYGRVVYGILPLLILPAFPLIKAARINSASPTSPAIVKWKELLILEILLWIPIILYEMVKHDVFTVLYTKSKSWLFLSRKEP